MSYRIAIIGIIIEDPTNVSKVNALLSEYRTNIVGRMGIPYEKRGMSVISVVVDASTDVINALTGRLAALSGISAKAVFSKVEFAGG